MNVSRCPALLFYSMLSLLILLSTGCTTPPEEERPLTRNEIRALLGNAKNPRSLYLTVFNGPAGPEFENAHRLHPNQVTSARMVGSTTAPAIIDVTGLTDTIFKALLDPSTPEGWASTDASPTLRLTPIGPPYYEVRAAHLKDADPGYMAHMSTMKIAPLQIESVLFCIRSATGGLGPFSRGIETPELNMVLGNDVLRNFRFVQFNYPNQMVSFSSSVNFPKPESRLLAQPPLLFVKGALATSGLVDGKETTVLLDLAGTYAASVPDDHAGKALRVHLGDLSLHGLAAEGSGTLGLTDAKYPRLGWEALNQFIITLDYHRRVIWFERP